MSDGTVQITVDREGVHVEVQDTEGKVLHREGVGAPTRTLERQRHVTCIAALDPERADLLARVLLNAATRARGAA